MFVGMIIFKANKGPKLIEVCLFFGVFTMNPVIICFTHR